MQLSLGSIHLQDEARQKLQILLNVSSIGKGSVINEFLIIRKIEKKKKKHVTAMLIIRLGRFQLLLEGNRKKKRNQSVAHVPRSASAVAGSIPAAHYPQCPRCLFFGAFVFRRNHHFQQHEILFASGPTNIGGEPAATFSRSHCLEWRKSLLY